MRKPSKGAAIAASAAMMALSACAGAADNPPGSTGMAIAASDLVHCYGLTACHSLSVCATAAAHDRALGIDRTQPYKELTAKQCLDIGGILGNLKPS